MSIVGIDVGGTSSRLAVIERGGKIVASERLKTAAERGASRTIEALIQASRELVAGSKAGPIEAVGIGITGPVDVHTGIVSNPFTLAGWPPTDFRGPFVEAFKVPVVIDNDANVAAVGEWWLGAGRGTERMTMVTIGTGIGVATLIDGKIQRTSKGAHGEAGHMVLDASGPECYCGARGCWEVLASGTVLDGHAKELAKRPDNLLAELTRGNPEQAGSAHLFEAATRGDEAALSVIDSIASWWGLGLVNLASTAMPDLFVLSGGVMEHFELVHERIRKVMSRHSALIPTDVPLTAATLGDDAGAVGAAKLALDSIAELPRATP